MNILRDVKLIIFDLDDTLVHSTIDYNLMKQSIRELFENSEDTKNINTVNGLLILLEKHYPDKINEARSIIDQIELNAVNNAKNIENAELIPEILKKHNLKGVILTNNSSRAVQSYLTKNEFKFLTEFDKIYTRDDVADLKPKPDGILKIIKDYNLKSLEVVYLGDSFIDNLAANNAQIKFILYNRRELPLEEFKPSPFKIISSLSEVESLIDTINSKD